MSASHWREAKFKGKKVWVAVDASGELTGDKVPMRYAKKAGAKIYTANRANVGALSGNVFTIDEAAEAAPAGSRGKKRGSGFGKAGTRSQAQAKLAKDAAQKLIRSLSDETIVCYTDGACKGNPGPAGSGLYVTFPDGRRHEASRSLGRATNNIGELTAIKMALELLNGEEVDPEAPVAILTDSDYSTGVLVRGWKAKKNTELILGIRDLLKRRPGVTLYWVAGHVGLEGNEAADRLAVAGVSGRTTARTFEK